LLKLGFEVAQSSVAKYMVKRRRPPSQGWRTFLRNHAPEVAAMDLFVVPNIGFDLLYAFVIVRLDRRDLALISVTTNPTAEWVARQITEAFPWDGAPGYMIRDCDRIYGTVVTRRLRAMGIRDKPVAPASPWQNGVVERLIGSIRRECVDHIIVLGDALGLGQGCARFSPGSANRCGQVTCHPRRTSSPLRPSLSFCYPGAYCGGGLATSIVQYHSRPQSQPSPCRFWLLAEWGTGNDQALFYRLARAGRGNTAGVVALRQTG
jgi:hypothetical protein